MVDATAFTQMELAIFLYLIYHHWEYVNIYKDKDLGPRLDFYQRISNRYQFFPSDKYQTDTDEIFKEITVFQEKLNSSDKILVK